MLKQDGPVGLAGEAGALCHGFYVGKVPPPSVAGRRAAPNARNAGISGRDRAGTRPLPDHAEEPTRSEFWSAPRSGRAGLVLQPFPASAGRWVGWSFWLCWLRPEGSCRGGAPAGSPMIVESPTGMPSEDSTKAGLPILQVPAADRYAVNARFAAAGSGAVSRCERRLPGFTAFAGPTYPSPEIGLTRCSQPPCRSRHFWHPGQPAVPAVGTGGHFGAVETTPKCPRCSGKTVRHPPHSSGNPPMSHQCRSAGPGNRNYGPWMSLPQLRWPIVAVTRPRAAASMAHRCGPPRGYARFAAAAGEFGAAPGGQCG